MGENRTLARLRASYTPQQYDVLQIRLMQGWCDYCTLREDSEYAKAMVTCDNDATHYRIVRAGVVVY